MKKFLLKLSLFLALCATAFVGAVAIYFVRLNTMSFALPEKTHIVFIGDSHIEVGVDERLIPGSFNFAKSGDPYFDQYFRLEKLLKDNPQITTVFITATPHSLARYGDARIFSNYTMQKVVVRAFPLYTEKEWRIYLENEPIRFFKFLFSHPLKLAKNALNPSNKTLMGSLGHHVVSEGRNLEKSVKAQKDPNAKGQLHGDDSAGNARQVEYLRKIVDFTRSRGARIIFLNPPLYHGEEFFDVRYFENLLKENFSDVEFWDYADFPIPDDCRQDINHLNRWGAEIFSRELAERMIREGIIQAPADE